MLAGTALSIAKNSIAGRHGSKARRSPPSFLLNEKKRREVFFMKLDRKHRLFSVSAKRPRASHQAADKPASNSVIRLMEGGNNIILLRDRLICFTCHIFRNSASCFTCHVLQRQLPATDLC